MSTTLLAVNKKAGTLKLTRGQESLLYGLLENLDDIAGGDRYDFDEEETQRDVEIVTRWGDGITSAIAQGRLCRTIFAASNDGSLADGLIEYLIITESDDVYYDADLGEERVILSEESLEGSKYAWVLPVAAFFSTCGGFKIKK